MNSKLLGRTIKQLYSSSFSGRFYRISFRRFNQKDLNKQALKSEIKESLKKSQHGKHGDGFNSDDYKFKRNVLLLIASGFVSVACLYLTNKELKPEERVETQVRTGSVSFVGKNLIGGPWNLIDTSGKPFSHENLKGKYYLIYFGFTRCPDVCPMSLKNISKAVKEIRGIPEFKYFDLEIVFVSVDPDRDSLERLGKYVKCFDKNIIGVTGRSNMDPELKSAMKKFKIHASKIFLSDEQLKVDKQTLRRNAAYVMNRLGDKDEPETNKSLQYSMDHTIITYLMGTDNEFLTWLSANLTHKEMKDKIIKEILKDLYSKRNRKRE